jgi:hypothetical protein
MIINGKDLPLNQNSGTVPDVSGALKNWFQPISMTSITKTVVNFKVIESGTPIETLGVWQPFSGKQLAMKPEGQRKWGWWTLHAEPGLVLEPDQIVTYLGINYRVMRQQDYRLYGYVEYELVEDYE